MKNAKQLIGTALVIGIIMMGASNARAGILMSDFTSSTGNSDTTNTCSVVADDKKEDGGVIIRFFKSILGKQATDVVFGKDDAPTNCGVIIRERG